ncbi:MAG: flagellar basal body P-ring formation protein FlgA, partial [Bryobacterales bacterium]|nr:flagellar basal body P-ring formation protein FlgA [Bryobacterales bacterium]
MRRLPVLLFVVTAGLHAECIQVQGDSIRAADLPQAQHLPPEEILLRAPLPGARRNVEPTELRRLLRLGVEAPAPAPVCFEQATEILTETRILEAMRAALGDVPVGIRVTDFSLYPVPRGAIEFPRSGLLAGPGASATRLVMWRGKVIASGGRSTPIWARVHIEAKRSVLVAKRSIEAGTQIEPGDVAFEERAQMPFDPRRTIAIEDAVGRTARKRIAAGGELQWHMLAETCDVEPRQTVTLAVQAEFVHLKMKAVSEGRARSGEWVWVKHASTGKRLRGRVTGPRQVLVEVDVAKKDETD